MTEDPGAMGERDDLAELAGLLDDDGDDGYFEQSATACCPRQTIPDSCSCLEGCACMCLDCICDNWGNGGESWSSPR